MAFIVFGGDLAKKLLDVGVIALTPRSLLAKPENPNFKSAF